jgi:hypothetical protein
MRAASRGFLIPQAMNEPHKKQQKTSMRFVKIGKGKEARSLSGGILLFKH